VDLRDQLIEELRATVARLMAELTATRAELAAARTEIAALKEELAKSSKNSSKPPSSDGPIARAERKKAASTGRKPGG
jgi:transposase